MRSRAIVGNEFRDEPLELNYHDIVEAEGEGRLRFIRAVERSDNQMLAFLVSRGLFFAAEGFFI